MRYSSNISIIILQLVVPAYATAKNFASNNSQGITWRTCDLDTQGLPLKCAKRPVPLDYTNSDTSDNNTLVLDLIKYPAPNGPSKGTIILNFGGPGEDGLQSMVENAPAMQPVTRGQFDPVSFDPRGTGKTLRFSCFMNDPTGQAASNYMDSTLYTSNDAAPGRLWAAAKIVSDSCYNNLREYGDLIGMAFVSKDMMRIVDALHEDGMLRYWGISGGTILGATVAAMFPDRMDKVLIDGVVNSHEYYHAFGQPEMFAGADATFEAFLDACVAAPTRCSLARGNRTADDLKKSLAKAFEDIKYNPVPFNGTIIDYFNVKYNILSFLYVAPFYPILATALDSLLAGDVVSFIGNTTRVIPRQDEALIGIVCGDKFYRASSLKEVQPGIETYSRMSKWFPDLALSYHGFDCSQWRFEANERYGGDFNVRTKHPILIIGNTYDPVTSWISAKNMSESFEGSVFLQHNGFGHLSFNQPSNCTNDAIFDYFNGGKLPEPNTMCQPNKPIF